MRVGLVCPYAWDSPGGVAAHIEDLLRQTGFARVDVLHKNVCFAAFGAALAGRRSALSPKWICSSPT